MHESAKIFIIKKFLVSFTPEQAKSHFIDIKFNGETVNGCPFVCAVADTSRVLLNLSNLGKRTMLFKEIGVTTNFSISSNRINSRKSTSIISY